MIFYSKGGIMIKINNELKEKFISVHMDDIQITTKDKPIIGTYALGPCTGFILYSKENRKAIVGHISSSQLLDDNSLEKLKLKISKIIMQNDLINASFDIMLIEGAQKSIYYKEWHELDILQNHEKKTYSLFQILEKVLTLLPYIKINSINKSNFESGDIQIVDIEGNLCDESNNEASKQFAFNTNTGKFITNDVFILPEKKETKKY